MGKVAENKTKATDLNVDDFIKSIPEEQKRKDCQEILKMMKKSIKAKPKIWGTAIIGFGELRLKSPTSGREVDWFDIGFAPRKANISLYLKGNAKNYEAELKKLGKHKTGGGCLYINKLSDVDVKVLQDIFNKAAKAKWFE